MSPARTADVSDFAIVVTCPRCGRESHGFNLGGEYDGDEWGIHWVQFATDHHQSCACNLPEDQMDEVLAAAYEAANDAEWPESLWETAPWPY